MIVKLHNENHNSQFESMIMILNRKKPSKIFKLESEGHATVKVYWLVNVDANHRNVIDNLIFCLGYTDVKHFKAEWISYE